jgi:hypothetical protein
MKTGLATLSGIGLVSVLAAGLALTVGLGGAGAQAQRIAFVIATGSTGGTYFPIGEAIAGIVSHPPGVTRCETATACGPAGLIASARTSPGAIANVQAVNAGQVDSALAQSDVVAEAWAGTGMFAKAGKQSHVRVIAELFPEDVHVIVATAAHVKNFSQLRGKRVSLGDKNSGTIATARAVMAAYRLPEWRVKASYVSADVAVQQMERGKLDAFFFVGGAPVSVVQDLINRGVATLVPIDGAARRRLLAAEPALMANRIPAGMYRGLWATDTVSVHALWIVKDSASPDLVFQLTRALFDSANRAVLDQSHPSARFITLDSATAALPAPLHPGAARYYRSIGRLPKPNPQKV